jgi:hypothetical protein
LLRCPAQDEAPGIDESDPISVQWVIIYRSELLIAFTLRTGEFIDPEVFFTECYLLDEID